MVWWNGRNEASHIQKYLFSMKLKRHDKDFWMHRKHRLTVPQLFTHLTTFFLFMGNFEHIAHIWLFFSTFCLNAHFISLLICFYFIILHTFYYFFSFFICTHVCTLRTFGTFLSTFGTWSPVARHYRLAAQWHFLIFFFFFFKFGKFMVGGYVKQTIQ